MTLHTIEVHKGRPRAPLPPVLEVRSLGLSEVEQHNTREGAGAAQPPLQRIGDRHRKLARALASGASNIEAAFIVGITPSRVVSLKADPTFKDLVAHYQAERDEEFTDFHAKMAGVGLDAIDLLQERLEENPSDFDNEDLANLVKLTADRTGYGPSRTENQNVNVNFGDRLEAARRRLAESRPVIEADYEEIPR